MVLFNKQTDSRQRQACLQLFSPISARRASSRSVCCCFSSKMDAVVIVATVIHQKKFFRESGSASLEIGHIRRLSIYS